MQAQPAMEDNTPTDTPEKQQVKTARKQNIKEIDNFVQVGVKEESLTTTMVYGIIPCWTTEGSRLYSNMARAACYLLAIPAFSTVLELNLSTAGRLITGSYSRVDPAYADMVLFLPARRQRLRPG